MTTTTATTARGGQTALGRTLLIGLGAGLAAGLANLLVYALARGLGAPFLVPMGGPGAEAAPLPFFAIIVTCVLPGLAAAVLYWGLGRFTARATAIFLGVAVVFGLLSLAGPLGLPIDLGTRLALASMHVVAGAIIAGALVRLAPQGK